MEVHTVRTPLYHSHLGEEKHQMLNLNRRLETYLSRVKLLEEENAALAKELHTLRHSGHGPSTLRKGLEEELHQARLEADAAWRDRVHTEVEVGRLTEVLQALDLQRQKEVQAQVEAKTKLEQSRRDLEEEHRAQIWLREKVHQLEQEMGLLVQTHQEDVAHLEATLTHSRATVSPNFTQRCSPTPNLLQLGQEYTLRATRARQETAEAYQGQLARLEESLNQSRSRLTQVVHERSESQLKLRALEKEIASAQDVRLRLEKAATQQRDQHSWEIREFQEHVEGLEAEKEELGQQIDHLIMENQGLLQQKMSLGLEVATYRALLDSESLKGDKILLEEPRNFPMRDAFSSPLRRKENYQMQQPASRKTTSLSSVSGVTGRSKAAVMSSPIVLARRPTTMTEAPKIPRRDGDKDATTSAKLENVYPKILQNGAVEHFRPQEVDEKVTYAEPLSPPNEKEDLDEPRAGLKEEDWINVSVPPEEKTAESVVSHQEDSVLSLGDEISQFTTPNLTPYHVKMTEDPCGSSDESEKDVPLNLSAEGEELQPPDSPIEAWDDNKCRGNDEEHVQVENSDSKTEALLEPDVESRTSSPASECESQDGVIVPVMGISQDDSIFQGDKVKLRREISMVGTNETEIEDRLYPDGEEMDTWDSVIERKVDLKVHAYVDKDEGKQYAEPEDNISVRKSEHREKQEEFVSGAQQDGSVEHSLVDAQKEDTKESEEGNEQVLHSEDEDDSNGEEDSPNVSMSWRTELEGDSYAQDNTLADTRPLIRYKSDETDANTQASHLDESESSEGEQDKKAGESGGVTWSESKSMKFGTMEDLCEEVEGETLDEEYDLIHPHSEDKDECGTLVNESENTEEGIENVSEAHWDEEMEEQRNSPGVPLEVVYDEELETDRLVEQELESLSTDSYSAFFAQKQSGGELILQDEKQDQATPESPHEVEQEDEHNESKDHIVFDEIISQTEISSLEETYLHLTSNQETKSIDASGLSEENVAEHGEDLPEVPESSEWEVPENLSEDFGVRHDKEGDGEWDDESGSVERFGHDDKSTEDSTMKHTEEPLEMFPEINDMNVSKANGKDNSLHGFQISGVKNEFWVSSLESGATFQPDEDCEEAEKKNNQNFSFGDGFAWESSGTSNVVNGTSRVDMDSSKAQKETETHLEGLLVHSEESDDEGECWSSGED